MNLIRTHKELEVYKLAFGAALEIYLISKSFPVEEKYSLTDQVRRSSRSVCANITEAFRKMVSLKIALSTHRLIAPSN